MLCLLGLLCFDNRVVRAVCLSGLLGWMLWISFLAASWRQWEILIFPLLVMLAYILLPKDSDFP